MRKTIFGLITIIAAIINIATAAMVPLAYVLHKYVIKVGEIQFSLLEWGLLAAIGYAVMNVLSGKIDQDDTKLYWLDTASSWIAALSINLSAGYVLLGLYKEKQNVVEIMQQDMALLLLMGLVAFSWLDLLWLQRKKTAMLASSAVSPAACAKPDLQVYKDLHKEPPSSAVTWSGGFMAAVIIVLLVGGTFYATNTVDLTSPSKPVAVQPMPAPVAPQAAVPPKQEEPVATAPIAPQLAPTPTVQTAPRQVVGPQKGFNEADQAAFDALVMKRASAELPIPAGANNHGLFKTNNAGTPPLPCYVPDGSFRDPKIGLVQRWRKDPNCN